MSEDTEELDSTNQSTEEVVNTDAEETVADTDTEDTDKLRESNKRLFERAKKAEAEAKLLKAERLKAEEQAKAPTSTNADVLSREEAILIAQGMNSDDLDELKAVASAKKLSLLKAKDTPLFQGYLEKLETERKKEKAKLSASKGSQTHQEKSTSDLTEEEHRKLVKETFGN